MKNFLTQGLHDVTKILAHRSDIRTVFYEATLVDKPGERHIFSIPDIHSSLPRNPHCLTCNQTSRNCSFHEALFSPSASFFVLQCLGPGVPWTEVRTTDDNQIRESTLSTLTFIAPLFIYPVFSSLFFSPLSLSFIRLLHFAASSGHTCFLHCPL